MLTNRTWSDVDGYTIEIYRQYDNDWIRLSMPGKPQQSGNSFGGPIGPVKFNLAALRKLGKDPSQFREIGGVLIRLAALPFVESVLADIEAERNSAAASLYRNVPGLDQLRAARDDEDRYQQQFGRMMEDENNDGAQPPRPVAVRYADLAARYPIAAAYLRAESWEHASHDVKATAGKRAKDRIAAGENYELALRDMDREWTAHVEQHVWD